MAERDLSQRWFERLDDALSLADHERAAAVEEIQAHVELAADELAARGVPRDVAVRRSLERLGAPERLARDITAAHRRPLDLLTAAGVAFRVTAATGFKAFVIAWAAVAVIALAFGLGVAAVRRVVGSGFLQVDWTPVLDGLIPAGVGAVVAFAVGRALVTPIAVAAHRGRTAVRGPILALGLTVAAAIALTAVEARWTAPTALAMASLPAWFALGVLRPAAFPSISVPGRFVALIAVVMVVAGSLLLLATPTPSAGESVEAEAFDPNVAYAAVGPFVDIEHPPLEVIETDDSVGPWAGPGPIRIERSGVIAAGQTDDWTNLRLEVWPGPTNLMDGSALDPTATEPLVTAPLTLRGREVHGSVGLRPVPGFSWYYVAITGVTADGERVQLAWPGVESWQWRGTVLQFAEALAR